MKLLMIIASDNGETIYNAMRLANVAQGQEDEVSVFMLGKGVTFEQQSSEAFNVMGEINRFEGDFYVWGVCLKAHGMVGSGTCPIAWMDDLYHLVKEADKVLTF